MSAPNPAASDPVLPKNVAELQLDCARTDLKMARQMHLVIGELAIAPGKPVLIDMLEQLQRLREAACVHWGGMQVAYLKFGEVIPPQPDRPIEWLDNEYDPFVDEQP